MAKQTRVAPTVVVDFRVHNHGTIFLLDPLTDAAREWEDQHLPNERTQWAGMTVVEHRFIEDIVFGIQNDGLVVLGAEVG